jgi:hypothetical protein
MYFFDPFIRRQVRHSGFHLTVLNLWPKLVCCPSLPGKTINLYTLRLDVALCEQCLQCHVIWRQRWYDKYGAFEIFLEVGYALEVKSCDLFDHRRHGFWRICKSGNGGHLLIPSFEVCQISVNLERSLTVQLVQSLPDLKINLPAESSTLDNPRSASNVPVIVGATFGSLGGLILVVAVVFILRRRRRTKDAHVDGPPEELRQRQQGPSTITPFTDESKPHTANGNNGYSVQDGNAPSRIPQTLRTEEISTAPATDGGVASGSNLAVTRARGNSPGNGNLRGELDHLRRVVERLRAHQVQQQTHQQGNIPDEAPPMYPNLQ